MIAHSLASCTLTPSIAAISLGLVGHRGLGERLGRNARFSSIGNALAAAMMGACGYYLSNEAVFYVTAALAIPTLAALWFVRASEIDVVRPQGPASEGGGWASLKLLLTNRALLWFGACITLFFVANAAMLPLVGSVLTVRTSHTATVLIAACIMAPQIVMALIAPAVGRAAQAYGRRPLLILGFAALPIRGLFFAYTDVPELLVLIQIFDGISAAVLGVMVPLVVADTTRGTGRFNLALGAVGTMMGLGAAMSTALSGFVADHFGTHSAFLCLSAVALAALGIAALVMPETRRTVDGGAAALHRNTGGCGQRRSTLVQVDGIKGALTRHACIIFRLQHKVTLVRCGSGGFSSTVRSSATGVSEPGSIVTMDDLCAYADRPWAFVSRYLRRRIVPHAAIITAVLGPSRARSAPSTGSRAWWTPSARDPRAA